MTEPEKFLLELGGTEDTGTGERVWYTGVWPPPETLVLFERRWTRRSYSDLPAGTPMIRAAKYLEAKDEPLGG